MRDQRHVVRNQDRVLAGNEVSEFCELQELANDALLRQRLTKGQVGVDVVVGGGGQVRVGGL
jgi:hypothetical protein